jgi:hypothetical protein
MSGLPCDGLHDWCRPWGWRLVAGKRASAHYFERVVDELERQVYASSSSVCGTKQLGDAGEHWRAHPHAGDVPLCSKCTERVGELPRGDV